MRALPGFLMTIAVAGCAGDALTPPRARVDAPPASSDRVVYPEAIPLPNGFSPEGIAFGEGTTFYVGSLATGAIFRGDAQTGTGSLMVPAQPGRSACGIKYDARGHRLWVAGSFTGQAYVYDAASGATLAVYQLGDPGPSPTSVNDAVVLRNAVYFTDDSRPVIYRIPLGPGGDLPPASAVQTIALTGDFAFVPNGINGNGIVATPNEDQLIVVNTFTGILSRIDPATGRTNRIDLGDGSVPWGDGLVLIGRTLYVVQGPFNQVAVVRLSADFTTGVVERPLTSAALQFPSAIGLFGNAFYAVNARFDVAPGPEVEYQVVRAER